MELREYLRLLRRRWKVVVGVIFVSLLAAGGWTSTQPTSYDASAQAFVAIRGDASNANAAYQGSLFSQDRVKSYIKIVNTPLILDPVRSSLGLSLTDDQLASKISASAAADTVVITISVSDGSATRARALANAVILQFAKAVPALESDGSTGSPVIVTVIRDAAVPASPTSPRPVLNAVLGLLGGLAFGIGLAVLRENLDTAVKGASDVLAVTGMAPLGGVVHDREAVERPIVVRGRSHSARAEAFRHLRTNLQFVDIDRPPRSIVVTSSLAGEGKSSTACNLALSLAQAGDRVVLVEADLRRPSFGKYLGLETGAGLTSVLIGAADIRDVLQPWQETGLAVLASGPLPPNPSELLGSNGMAELLQTLVEHFDHVIIDAPPLLPVTDGAVISALADGVLLVTEVKRTKREQLAASIDALSAVNARLLGVVLNRVPQKGPDAYSYSYGYSSKGVPRLEDTGASMRPAARPAPDQRRRPVAASDDLPYAGRDSGRPPRHSNGYASPSDRRYQERGSAKDQSGARRMPTADGYLAPSQLERLYEEDGEL